jgi:hypothetical protein
MGNGQDKHEKVFHQALSQEEMITESYTKGEISQQEQYNQVIKVWSSVVSNTLAIFILVAAGILGITTFLLAMILPFFND